MNINTVTFVAPNLACGEARGGRIPRSGAVTDEQRSHRPNSAQPGGRQVLLAQASLLAPHRPQMGMLVARASPAPKIPCRERHRIYVHDHLTGARENALLLCCPSSLMKPATAFRALAILQPFLRKVRREGHERTVNFKRLDSRGSLHHMPSSTRPTPTVTQVTLA